MSTLAPFPNESLRRLSTCVLFSLSGAVLADTPAVLDPIVVSATATERRLSDAPASITVIERGELERRGAEDLADALRGSPGIQLGGVGMTRRGISIRGMPSEHTLVLIDGKRVNSASDAVAHADFDLGWVPIEAIERVEVIRGPMSSLYGSEALGGVVNVITRAATDEWRGSAITQGSAAQGADGGATHRFGGYLSGPLIPGVLGIAINAEQRRREQTAEREDPSQSALEGRKSTSGDLTLNWTPDDRQRIDLGYGEGDERRWRHTRTAGARPIDYTAHDRIERERFSLSHRGQWDWGDSQVRYYRHSLDRRVRYTDGQTPSSPHQQLTDDVFDASTSLPLGERHLFSLGGEWRRERLDDQGFPDGEAEAIHRAAFFQDEIALAEAWSLLLGTRFDHHQNYGWENSPRGYLVYRPNAAWTFKGGVGRGFKAPSLKQLSPGYSAIGGGGQFTIYGNPALEPETNTSYELNADYQGDGWNLHAGLFHNDLRNLIQTQCVEACGQRGEEIRHYQNLDRARIRGIELGAGVSLSSSLYWTFDYTYLDARDLNADRRLADRSRHLLNNRLSWTPREGFEAQLRNEYVGAQASYGTRGENYSLPGYSLWHLEFSQRLNHHLELIAGIDNLTNQRLDDRSDHFTYYEPARTYRLALSASF